MMKLLCDSVTELIERFKTSQRSPKRVRVAGIHSSMSWSCHHQFSDGSGSENPAGDEKIGTEPFHQAIELRSRDVLPGIPPSLNPGREVWKLVKESSSYRRDRPDRCTRSWREDFRRGRHIHLKWGQRL
jgi:hypothetical protein